MKNHTIKLQPCYFDLMEKGKKTLEGRLYDEKRKKFEIGDTIRVYKSSEEGDNFQVKITSLSRFKSFENIPDDCILELGFEGKTHQEVVEIYRAIYSKEDEEKYGILLIGVEKID